MNNTKIINYKNGKEYHPNFADKDIIPLDWNGWKKDYSQEYGVAMFRDEVGRIVLRKKHIHNEGAQPEARIPHYHYEFAESISLGSICDKCQEPRQKKVNCCGKLVNDFFTVDNCDECSCCSFSDMCVQHYIANHLYWNITSSCYLNDQGEYIISD